MVLQEWEKASKSSLTLFNQIDKITIEDSKTFASAVTKAKTAAEKLDSSQLVLVTNYDRLLYMLPFAEAITATNALKVSNKDDYRDKVAELHTKLFGNGVSGAAGLPTLVAPTTGDSEALNKVLISFTITVRTITIRASVIIIA